MNRKQKNVVAAAVVGALLMALYVPIERGTATASARGQVVRTPDGRNMWAGQPLPAEWSHIGYHWSLEIPRTTTRPSRAGQDSIIRDHYRLNRKRLTTQLLALGAVVAAALFVARAGGDPR